MRAVIQRVSSASVEVENKITGSIDMGFMVLLGIETEDSEEDAKWLAAKIASMRIFGDDKGLMNLSLQDVGGSILLISQFTLHASTKKGNRPSFIRAARPEKAIPLYQFFKQCLHQNSIERVEEGIFGAMMNVSLINEGPVTIIIDSKNKE